MIKLKHEQAMKWVWDYAATNYALWACLPASSSVDMTNVIGITMARHLTTIYYGNETGETEITVIDALEHALFSMKQIIARGVSISYKMITEMCDLLTSAISVAMPAGAVTGGIIAATVTITLGWGFASILDDMVTGKISAGDVKTMVESEAFKAELGQMYKQTMKQIRNDPRFAADKFGIEKQ